MDSWTAGWLRRRAVVLDVETERYGRTYAGRKGRVSQVSRHPYTGAFAGCVVRLDGGPEVQLKPGEVSLLDG